MVIFFVLAAVAVAAAVGVIAQRSVVRSALFLLVNFCCLAGLYILLNAQFLAMVQAILYAGAIVVLFLFIVALLGMERAIEPPDARRYHAIAGGLLGILLLAGLIWALISVGGGEMADAALASDVRDLGAALVGDYAVPFELASIVLLVAIIGAVVLARKRVDS
jgi:NADH-quinone oxidoreductase subunit J